MPAVSAADLVTTWEQGLDRHPVDRALLLLAMGDSGANPASLPEVCLGEREDRLLALHADLFGDRMECFVACPACGEGVELELSVAALRDRPAPADPGRVRVEAGGLVAEVRLPHSRDLAAAVGARTPEAARDRLLARCVRTLARDGAPVAVDDLAPEERAALSEAIGEADPRAETLLDTRCSACGAEWTAALDMGSYLWRRVDREASRLIDAVDVLARAYGWTEAEVLALSPTRRRLYLERAGG